MTTHLQLIIEENGEQNSTSVHFCAQWHSEDNDIVVPTNPDLFRWRFTHSMGYSLYILAPDNSRHESLSLMEKLMKEIRTNEIKTASL